MPSLTVVVADTENHVLARAALERSLVHRDVKEVLIYSDDASRWPGYTIRTIDRIRDIDGYNRCVIDRLADDVTTDAALVVQYDGFILDPAQWSDVFYRYDYIGAPWYDSEGWTVGNGGFSLRSRRLIDAVRSMSQDYDPAVAEDVYICKHLRRRLAARRIDFAPIEVARRFSCEWPIPKWKTFGFHGIFHLPAVYADRIDFLMDNLSDKTLARRWKFMYPFLQVHHPAQAQALRSRFEESA